ncbi:hypothetical protein GCM10023148_01440 [Actinokineospora soli]
MGDEPVKEWNDDLRTGLVTMSNDMVAGFAGVVAGGGGVRRLAEAVVDNRGRTARARDRGVTMVSLVDSIAAADLDAEIRVRESDGASWSITLTGPDARPAAPEARDR